jgi:uncharacterized protein YjiS (DUF1127 family)
MKQATELRPERQMAMMQRLDSRTLDRRGRQHDGSRYLVRTILHSSVAAASELAAPAGRNRLWCWLRPLHRFARAPLRSIDKAVLLLLKWQERARERGHLLELSDHILKDLGLSRADVEHEVSKQFRRD